MSVRVLSRVWDGFPGGGTDLLTMLALADWSDDDGRCWPSVAAIAKKVRLQKRQTQYIVNRLVTDGFLSVDGNVHGGAPGETRRYRIILERLTGAPQCTGAADCTGAPQCADGCSGVRETGALDCTQTVNRTVNTRQIRQSAADASGVALPGKPSRTAKGSRLHQDIRLFDEFWTAYPKKRAKDDAMKAFVKRKPGRDLLEQLLGAIEAQKRSDDWLKENGKYIPYPATWLNDGRWMDEIDAEPDAGSGMFAGGI